MKSLREFLNDPVISIVCGGQDKVLLVLSVSAPTSIFVSFTT